MKGPYDLNGRTAIVTGAARGIGYAIVECLLACGARVAAWDVDEKALVKAVKSLSAGGEVYPVTVDLCDIDSVESAVKATQKQLDSIEILVNNAGIAGPSMPLWEYPVDAWHRVIEVDLVGVFHACRAVVPVMRQADYGRIVNTASVAGKEGNPNMSAYSAAKAGVIGLTKVPMGRLGTVEENANLVAWLCSPNCSFSTGAVFDISGGRCTY